MSFALRYELAPAVWSNEHQSARIAQPATREAAHAPVLPNVRAQAFGQRTHCSYELVPSVAVTTMPSGAFHRPNGLRPPGHVLHGSFPIVPVHSDLTHLRAVLSVPAVQAASAEPGEAASASVKPAVLTRELGLDAEREPGSDFPASSSRRCRTTVSTCRSAGPRSAERAPRVRRLRR